MQQRWKAVGLFGLLATLWGFSFPAISVGLKSLEPLLFAALRYDVAAVILLGLAVVRTDAWRPTQRNDLSAVVAGGLFLVASNALLFVGQQTVPSGVAAVMQSLAPIATSLWALALLPQERISPVGWVGIVLGFVGVGLIVRPDPANLLVGSTLGKLLILGQVTAISLGGVLVQRAKPTIDRAALSGWSMVIGAGVLHVLSLAIGETLALPAAPKAQAAVLYLGVFATALAFLIYFTLLDVRGALETSLVSYIVPIVATLAGVLILDERITALTLVGFLVVFTGFLLLKRQAIVGLITESSSPATAD